MSLICLYICKAMSSVTDIWRLYENNVMIKSNFLLMAGVNGYGTLSQACMIAHSIAKNENFFMSKT